MRYYRDIFQPPVEDYNFNYEIHMNNVNPTDVTFMSLALADFSAATATLVNHDYLVATGLVGIGVILVFLYHKFGSS